MHLMTCPQNDKCDAEFMVGTHLISAVEQENVFICGHGTIDGDSPMAYIKTKNFMHT